MMTPWFFGCKRGAVIDLKSLSNRVMSHYVSTGLLICQCIQQVLLLSCRDNRRVGATLHHVIASRQVDTNEYQIHRINRVSEAQ